jgi:hypothetical protein
MEGDKTIMKRKIMGLDYQVLVIKERKVTISVPCLSFLLNGNIPAVIGAVFLIILEFFDKCFHTLIRQYQLARITIGQKSLRKNKKFHYHRFFFILVKI